MQVEFGLTIQSGAGCRDLGGIGLELELTRTGGPAAFLSKRLRATGQ